MKDKLVGVVLRIKNPAKLAKWYEQIIGTKITENADKTSWICKFTEQSAGLKLIPGSGAKFKSEASKTYWKIGLALADVDLARSRIMQHGVQVSEPSQFRDIGYLCHLSDQDGFTIELLQHTFKNNFSKPKVQEDTTLGQVCTIGQITLRCSDIDKTLNFYQDILGMKLLSIQNVEPYGFTLYFLAFTNDTPPKEDLNSVEIREWLWQRPYTTLELQHVKDAKFQGFSSSGCGVDSIEMNLSEGKLIKKKLESAGLPIKTFEGENASFQVIDPDGAVIRIFH